MARLAAHPTWRRLLHVEQARDDDTGPDALVPAVIEPSFYLSEASPLSPRAELRATLSAFVDAARVSGSRSSATPSSDDDPRCRYPARWWWLSRELPERLGRLPAPDCPDLRAWLDVDAVESLSLVHVSGYFASPASAFGHLLLRVETEAAGGARGLRDLGVNFGAAVPPEDGSLAYVLKGLFGGYEAGFTEQAFHFHDAVYSGTEQRDMWAYRLALDADARTLLLYHLRELTQARFRYYFLSRNCAWYLAALLELALERPLRDTFTPWQLPASVFATLDEVRVADGVPLVETVTYVPSLEREFSHAFAQLEPADARRANALIVRAGEARGAAFDTALGEASTAVLDVLLAWADLGAIGVEESARKHWQDRKHALLGERLRRAPSGARVPPPVLPPPARGPRSLSIALAAVHEESAAVEGGTRAMTLRFAPYAHDLLNANRGSLVDADFRLLDLSLQLEEGRSPRLRSLDLLAIEKLAVSSVAIADRPRRVWRVAARLNGERADCANCSPFVASAGIGFATRPLGAARALTLHALADLELGSERSLAGPSVGVLYRPFDHSFDRVGNRSGGRAGGRGHDRLVRALALRAEGRLLAATDGETVGVLRLGVFATLPGQYAVALQASRIDEHARVALEVSRRF